MERSDKYTQKPRAKEIFYFAEVQQYKWSAATNIVKLAHIRIDFGGIMQAVGNER